MTAEMAVPIAAAPGEIRQRLAGTPCLVLLDVDGTLAPIAPTPTLAAIPDATRRLLVALVARPETIVGVVSGRGAADARRLVGVDGLWVLGNHGAEVSDPAGEITIEGRVAPYEPVMAALVDRLRATMASVPGAVVEDKRWSVSVHYRQVAADRVAELRAVVIALADAAGLAVTEGKQVVEIRPPVAVNKGTAVLAVARRLGGLADGAALLFAGDDRTDEDAFAALREHAPHAVTVRVRSGGGVDAADAPVASRAEYDVADPRALADLLALLAAPAAAADRRSGARAAVPGAYLPIADYGVIGDLHSAALIGLSGSIDWFCAPSFDSPSVFAALLDAERGGRFRIAPAGAATSTQAYLPSTTVLVTTFRADGSVVTVTDFMPIGPTGAARPYPEIHRRVECTEGEMALTVTFAPRFHYATAPTFISARRHGLLATDADDEVLTLASPPDLLWQLDGGVACVTIKLCVGESCWFVLRYDDDEVQPVTAYESPRKFQETCTFWRDWGCTLQYAGPFRDAVERSALTLKLMCFQPTGAIIAAPTTSLPEEIGGVRNWDYRFSWIRDSAFVLYSLSILGHSEEADRYMAFLKRVARKTTDTHLQIMYGIDGRRHLPEETLPHLEGYRGSAPVRVGNGAHDQLQLDVYGELLATAYLWSRANPVSEGTWVTLERLVSWVADHWRQPDSGIWEVRAGLQHYVLSKVMCWVALDRGVRMAQEFGLTAPIARWEAERDAVHADVMARGWSEAKQSFVQYYGSDALDASNLVIPMVQFLPPTHERIIGTVRATLRELTSDEELVYRYRNDDGLPGGEGIFSICSFWLAEALALSGDRAHAERIFRRLLTHANHLGLYSEEIDPATGEFLGNFPQAFTHIALINCAHVLEVLADAAPADAAGVTAPEPPAAVAAPAAAGGQ